MATLDSLPQELLELILVPLIWQLPIRYSVFLRSISRRFRDNFDQLLLQQKRLLARHKKLSSEEELREARSFEQQYYNLQDVMSVGLATDLVHYEWENDVLLPRNFRILMEEVERRIINSIRVRNQDQALVRKELCEVLVRWTSLNDNPEDPVTVMNRRARSSFYNAPHLGEIYRVLNNRSESTPLTADQELLLNQEAMVFAAALSDSRYLKFLTVPSRDFRLPTSQLILVREYGREEISDMEMAAMCGRPDNLAHIIKQARTAHYPMFFEIAFDRSLDYVAKSGNAEAAKLFLEAYQRRGFKLSHANLEFRSPFETACINNNLELARVMESVIPADRSDTMREACLGQALRAACIYGVKLSTLQYLTDLGAPIDYSGFGMVSQRRGQTPILKALSYGHKHLIRALLDMGANPHHYLLAFSCYWPVFWGDVAVLQILVDAGVNLYREMPVKRGNAFHDAILPNACRAGQIGVVRFMLEKYPAIVEGEHFLAGVESAMDAGYDNITDLLLDTGVNLQGEKGAQLLFNASELGKVNLVRKLVQMGADLNAKYIHRDCPVQNLMMTALAVAEHSKHVHETDKKEDYEEICTILRAASTITSCQQV